MPLIDIGGELLNSIKQSIASYYESVNKQAPLLGYLGMAFWSAWILSTSGVQDWISSSSGSASVFTAAYIETRMVLIVSLVIYAVFNMKFSGLFRRGKISLGISLLAVIGNVLLVSSWLAPGAYPFLLHIGSLLSGFGAAFLLMIAGMSYSSLSSWRAMLLVMLSQLVAACIYLVITVAPTEISVPLFCCLPLAGSATFALIPWQDRAVGNKAMPKPLVPSFARLVVMVFALRLSSNYIKTLLVASQSVEAVQLGIVENILLKMLVAIIFIFYAFNTSKTVDYGRVCYYLFVGSTITLIVLSLFEGQIPLFYALNGTLSGLAGNIAFCVFAYICFQSRSSPLHVFGLGYSAVLLGSLLGQVTGGQVAAQLAGSDVYLVPFLIVAYIFVLIALLVCPPGQIDKLILPAEREDAIDIATKTEFDNEHENLRACCDKIAQGYGLTNRENEVLYLLAQGHGRNYVANRLQLSINTVRSHSRSIYYKTSVHSHTELMVLVDSKEDLKEHGSRQP